MGESKPHASPADKTIYCQADGLTVVCTSLAVAENQPTHASAHKNRMIPFTSLAEACSAINSFIRCCADEPSTDGFDELALGLFAFQFVHNTPYANFCRTENHTPETVADWRDIPAVSTRVLKSLDLTVLPVADRETVFRSSGTTQANRSRHFHSRDSLAVYHTSLWTWFAEHLLDESANRLLFLCPELAQAPKSSLVHMMDTVAKRLANRERCFGTDGQWRIDGEAAVDFLHDCATQNKPVTILGTAFSFVHLLDHLDTAALEFQLPSGSAAMETGGYKGRSREMPKAELHQAITTKLGVASERIICEYGMCELSSQAYDGKLGQANAAPRLFRFPPWARARVVSPETLADAELGQAGLLQVVDLANVSSVLSLQTEDLAKRHADGFELLGRAELAESRGCSLMNLTHA